MKYRKKPVVIEAITFEELVRHGKKGASLIGGMPWSFDYYGHPVSHENDECYLITTLEGTMRMTPQDVLITGVQGEIYPCKLDIFEKTYELAADDNMTFGDAIQAMKQGNRIARRGWNGKGMFVVYQKGYPQGIPCNKQTAEAWGMNEGELFRCEPYLQIKMVNGSHAMWVPSINDVLAEDWSIVQ